MTIKQLNFIIDDVTKDIESPLIWYGFSTFYFKNALRDYIIKKYNYNVIKDIKYFYLQFNHMSIQVDFTITYRKGAFLESILIYKDNIKNGKS